MLLHAQVGWPSSTAAMQAPSQNNNNNDNQYYLSVYIIRLLNGSLTCTCQISWMLNLCFTAVGVFFSVLLQFYGTCNNLFKVESLLHPSRYFIPQVSRDAHSKSSEFLLCRLTLKCADFRFHSQLLVSKSLLFSPPAWQTELLSRCKDTPALAEVLHLDGNLLTETILQVTRPLGGELLTFVCMWHLDSQSVLLLPQAVGGMSPRSLTEHFSEVLMALNRHCPVLLAQWLEETLQTPGFPSAEVSTEQKHTFSQQLLRSVTVLYLTFKMQLLHWKSNE